jgi:riboflavin synthase
MFTGIVAAVGSIVSTRPFVVDAGRLSLRDVRIGDSICVQGCCLTVTGKRGRRLSFDVSRETLRVTAGLDAAGPVNLEKAMALGDRMGGHLVTGHVDGVGRVLSVIGSEYTLRAPQALSRYIAQKGSITVDGVSLTVNRVRGTAFDVNLIPHTRKVTTLKRLNAGTKVNLEVDLVARYVARLTSPG